MYLIVAAAVIVILAFAVSTSESRAAARFEFRGIRRTLYILAACLAALLAWTLYDAQH